MKKNRGVFSNKFDLSFYNIFKMDLFKELVELNNKIDLENLANEYYTIDSDEEEEVQKIDQNFVDSESEEEGGGEEGGGEDSSEEEVKVQKKPRKVNKK